MAKSALSEESLGITALGQTAQTPPAEIRVGLLTGGFDKPYAVGMAIALVSKGICLDYVGSDEVDSPVLHSTPNLSFLNLRGNQRADVTLASKVSRILAYYARLVRYASIAKPKVFHILWNSRFQFLDRTFLMLFYKLNGKKIALTVHNVNAGKRDSNDSLLNRLTLKIQYHVADHLFVHTEKMKSQLLEEFNVRDSAITVIPFGINNSVPDTNLTPAEAKQRLGLKNGEKVILFFGTIRPYKGLEYLVDAFQQVAARYPEYRLIIAGEPKMASSQYMEEIDRRISRDANRDRIIQKIQYIPDEETELYFKAADVLVLPYTEIFQSGVLFLAYSFGLPAIAADVGSLREDMIEGQTGFLCKPRDSGDLARAIELYFGSELFEQLNSRRQQIRDHANARHSWDVIGQATRDVYETLLGNRLSDPI